MMISPGTPRIHSSKGTMGASFCGHSAVRPVTAVDALGRAA